MRSYIFLSLVVMVSFNLSQFSYAQSGPLGWGKAEIDDEMETDRPDFTEGTLTIAPGHLQMEFGYTYTEDESNNMKTKSHSVPELLARVGLIQDLELRIGWEGYLSTEFEDEEENGVSDLSIGFKHAMYKQQDWMPDLSFIGELSLPTGSKEYTSDEVEPEIKFLWGYGFEGYSVSGNLNFSGPIGEEGRYFEIANSITTGIDLTEDIGMYVEYFGFYPAEEVIETTENYINGGFTYAMTKNLQFDVRVGFGMNDAADDLFTGAGFAIRM